MLGVWKGFQKQNFQRHSHAKNSQSVCFCHEKYHKAAFFRSIIHIMFYARLCNRFFKQCTSKKVIWYIYYHRYWGHWPDWWGRNWWIGSTTRWQGGLQTNWVLPANCLKAQKMLLSRRLQTALPLPKPTLQFWPTRAKNFMGSFTPSLRVGSSP